MYYNNLKIKNNFNIKVIIKNTNIKLFILNFIEIHK